MLASARPRQGFTHVDFEHALSIAVGAAAAIWRDVLAEVVAHQGVDRTDACAGRTVLGLLLQQAGINAGTDLLQRVDCRAAVSEPA